MSGFENGDWHNANGGGLPFRPPTVNEALPYSPFTSVVPFSPDIIPFPTAEPPTPPTTLSPDQRAAAKKAVGILNEEIKGPSSTAQHLEATFRELRSLLGNPLEMTEYRFKPTAQLATPPPDSPNGQPNGSPPTKTPELSPFASMLLKQTDMHYLPARTPLPQRSRPAQETSREVSSQVPVRTPSQPARETPRKLPSQASVRTPSQPIHFLHLQNGASQHPPDTPVSPPSSAVSARPGHPSEDPLSAPSSTAPSRSGPSVIVKPLPPSVRKDEYRRYDHTNASDSLPKRHSDEPQLENGLSTLRPQDREIAEQKIEQLHRFVRKVSEDKEDLDESGYFSKVSCLDSDLCVLNPATLDRLYDKVQSVIATSCFSSVSVETILEIHSLCEPSITASDQASMFNQADSESWINDLPTAESGLRAARLALTGMLEGCEDRRTAPEDLVVAIMGAVKRILDLCILPVLESRRNGESSELFSQAYSSKDKLHPILRLCTNALQLLGKLLGKVALSDSAVNPIEYLALALFVQQNSESEKDSIFGIQRFEALRQAAMEVLTQIFASYADHQHYITTEILNNLEKLPDKGANVRQFKSPRDPPIMSVSALFMRFVQVAATNQHNQHKKIAAPRESVASEDDESDYDQDDPSSRKAQSKTKGNNSASSLALRLMQNAREIAGRIAANLTDRALNVSKSGDKPFRNLLDMFVEDFCNVLGSPEWPAAALLLQLLLIRMINILQTPSNKDMALTMMGTMGCGIIDFKLRVRRLKRDLDVSQSELSARLSRLAEDALDSGVHNKDLLSSKGPYRMIIESLPDYLKVATNKIDPHLLSVRGCYLTFWLDSVISAAKPTSDDVVHDQAMSDLQQRLQNMILDSKWLSREYKFQNMSDTQSQLAAGIITLQDKFCQYFNNIVHYMIQYTQESAVTLKSRAIKNIEAFLDKDAQTVPDQLVKNIVNLLRDHSPLVRADAVSLVSKCLEGNPDLERHCIQNILSLTTDPSNGPKKKAINLLKKIYPNSASSEHKFMIVASLLLPSQDHEKSIAEMARQALEDIWLKSLNTDAKTDENRLKLRRIERASLLVQTVRRIQGLDVTLEAFEQFFADALASKSANAAIHFCVCKELVADMVEGVISPESMAAGCSQEHVLQTLSILARVSPALFTLDQLQLLKLYVKNPATADDLDILRPTVTIFRSVLPHLPNVQVEFAEEVWKLLSGVFSKLAQWAARGKASGKSTLLDVIRCSWIISPLANKGVARLIQVVLSILVQLQPLSSSSKDQAIQAKNKIISYLILVGTFGKVCNFDEDHADAFRTAVATAAKQSVDRKRATEEQLKPLLNPGGSPPSLLLLETVRPFAKQSWDLEVREYALCSAGEICQGAPSLFMRSEIEAMFKVVFKNDIASLKRVVLTQFHDFFVKAEQRSDGSAEVLNGANLTNGTGRLGTTFAVGDGQLTTNFLARKFLLDIVEIALKNNNELALLATKIIASISRQGLVHPKECGPALIALGTSPNVQVAQIAAVEHKKIHDAHESMFEKEYMAAVRMAYQFQQDVYEDAHGMTAPAYKPKILPVFNVLKGGNRKTLKKFIDNLCRQMDFELAKLGEPGVGADTLLYARFCLENLALFDVPKLEDLAIMTNSLESIVLKNTGPSVGVAIETEMAKRPSPEPQIQPQLQAAIDVAVPSVSPALPTQNTQEPVSAARLMQITQACMILQMMWETRSFIRKAYNLQNLPGRIPHKDFQKPAFRNNLVSGKELWERLDLIYNSLDSREAMMNRCYDFAELLEVDKDAHVGDDENDDDPAGYVTPEEADDAPAVPNSGKGRKRKFSASGGNTPKKARGRPAGSKSKKRNSRTPELDGWD